MSEHIGADEAQRLLDAATPGPWYVGVDDSAGKDALYLWCEHDDGSWVEGKQPPYHMDPFTYDPTPMERATAELIAAAPRLAAEVVRLRRELDARTDDAGRRAIRSLGIDPDLTFHGDMCTCPACSENAPAAYPTTPKNELRWSYIKRAAARLLGGGE